MSNRDLTPQEHYDKAMEYLDRADDERTEVSFRSFNAHLANSHLFAAEVVDHLHLRLPVTNGDVVT